MIYSKLNNAYLEINVWSGV